ncbi:MAG: carbon storage regulator [Planctomycetia bacterium]|nr:carbon storage regulator [Planctomycetia bacterium]
MGGEGHSTCQATRTKGFHLMQLFTTRTNDKILLPDIEATIEVVAVETDGVRLGISAPETIRVVREGRSDRQNWKPEVGEEPASSSDIQRMIDKRLEIAREGLNELREYLRAGQEDDARLILEKVDEDLHLLRRRVRREFQKADSLSCGV